MSPQTSDPVTALFLTVTLAARVCVAIRPRADWMAARPVTVGAVGGISTASSVYIAASAVESALANASNHASASDSILVLSAAVSCFGAWLQPAATTTSARNAGRCLRSIRIPPWLGVLVYFRFRTFQTSSVGHFRAHSRLTKG